ncbi:MAG: 4-hydroxy-3-methylbut-2-enyl diphosphate reductase [Candidatus Omnitrophota bacterium]|nr:MAG: 4-hydroxy-3-methylbut-2-enyl diphosphate reductase [Candidatus Omnitrophota bacterium]
MPTKTRGLPIIRRGFGLKEEVADTLQDEYKSHLIQHLRENDFSLEVGDLRILLAKEFGFCYGVDRAVDYAYETRQMFPEKTIYITSEIIHNPRVNRNLREMDVRFLSGGDGENYSYDDVRPEDIVILPAFGASVEEMEKLAEIGCTMVDTTCGSVMNVWKRVEKNAKDGYTSIIHGKYTHEETVATSSRVLQFPGGRYLVIRDENEAQIVCDYIRQGDNREEFLEKFRNAVSPDFDPDRDLQKVGLANQTTMLSSESMYIARMIEEAIRTRYEKAKCSEHYRSFDTICSATQERQDAMLNLAELKPDVFIVVGGYNSSNTSHLCEIGMRYAPTYHISEADCIVSAKEILHKPFTGREEVVTDNWLISTGRVTIGITSGASTPDKVVEETIIRLLECRGYTKDSIMAECQAKV